MPKNTITGFVVTPKKTVLFSSLKLNTTEFERVRIPLQTDRAYYVSEVKGQEVEVFIGKNGIEEVVQMRFKPSKSKAGLRCENHKSN